MAVAVDAMGGDRAPAAIVEGCLRAVTRDEAPEVLLVGDREILAPLVDSGSRSRLEGEGSPRLDRVRIQHAPQTIGMNESPALALRRKPDSSIAGCIEAVRDGRANAIVTAGNTGAIVAAATRSLPLGSVRRPGLAVTLPSRNRVTTVIDVGANVHCKPAHLYDYGIMATEFCRAVLGIAEPSIGLMNIGEEDEKGNELVRRTMELFRRSDLHFLGNIEGQDVFSGRCDIVVCEGFVGNVILKVSEGFAETTLAWLKDTVSATPAGDGERRAWEEALRVFREHTDYSNYGGGLLLGVDTTCVICHGRSGPSAIANAVLSASRFVEAGVRERVLSGLERHRSTRPRNSTGEMLGRSS